MMLINHSILDIPINEVYFGKSKELLDIENQLDIFRNKYMGKYMNSVGASSDPDLIKFNRMIEDFFGFGCCSIYLLYSKDILMGAMNLPLSFRLDIVDAKKYLIVDKQHYKFDKKADIGCFIIIPTAVIFNTEFSTSEVFALILHEIGHVFYSALSDKNMILSNMYSIINICMRILDVGLKLDDNIMRNFVMAGGIIGNTNIGVKWITDFNNILNENHQIIKKTIEVIQILATLPGVVYKFIDLLTLGIFQILGLKNIPKKINFKLLKVLFMYNEERTGDNFATIYGYGPDIISILQKFDNRDIKTPSNIINIYNKIPIISHIYSANYNISNIIFSIFDEHPTTISRAKDQIALLEYELNKTDIDPKTRKYLQRDIKVLKNKINTLIDLQGGIKNKNIIRNLYFKVLYNFTDSRSLKDMLLDDIHRFERYDKTYNEKIK